MKFVLSSNLSSELCGAPWLSASYGGFFMSFYGLLDGCLDVVEVL